MRMNWPLIIGLVVALAVIFFLNQSQKKSK